MAASAIVAELAGWPINPAPLLTHTCYSFVDRFNAIHVSNIHTCVAAEKTLRVVPVSGGLSTAPNELDRVVALNWTSNLWADTLA